MHKQAAPPRSLFLHPSRTNRCKNPVFRWGGVSSSGAAQGDAKNLHTTKDNAWGAQCRLLFHWRWSWRRRSTRACVGTHAPFRTRTKAQRRGFSWGPFVKAQLDTRLVIGFDITHAHVKTASWVKASRFVVNKLFLLNRESLHLSTSDYHTFTFTLVLACHTHIYKYTC